MRAVTDALHTLLVTDPRSELKDAAVIGAAWRDGLGSGPALLLVDALGC